MQIDNNKPMLIGLLAKKQHGKDTAADYLVEKYGFIKMAYADTLKHVCATLFDFSKEQLYGNKKEEIDLRWNMSPRQAMQFIGTDIVRNQMDQLVPEIGSHFWIKRTEISYLNALKENPNAFVVVSDIRFQDEADLIHKYNGTVIKIVRPELSSTDEHVSEKGIDEIKTYDHLIINDSSLDNYYKRIESLFEIE